jgi:16S rRNA processing protein RimM
VGGQSDFVTVARLLRPQGNRGELSGELTSDDAGFLERFSRVHLFDGAARREQARIERTWPHKNRLIFKFEGVDTISQAERLAGWQVQIPAGERPPAPAGRYYLSDLEGCRVVDAGTGRQLGEVRRVEGTAAAPLLEVEQDGRTFLVPFAASICVEIDTAGRIIRVELPEGLEELDQP